MVLLLQVLPTVPELYVRYNDVTTRRELDRPQPPRPLRSRRTRGPESHRTAGGDSRSEEGRVRPRLRLQSARPRRETRAALQPLGAGARSVGPSVLMSISAGQQFSKTKPDMLKC